MADHDSDRMSDQIANSENDCYQKMLDSFFPQNNELGKTLGLSLRDWFAGQFICGNPHEYQDLNDMADDAYRMADAMMEARKK